MTVSDIPVIDVGCASREALVRHIDDLEFVLTRLLPASVELVRLIQRFGMTPQQARVAAALSRGVICSKEQLLAFVTLWNGDPAPKIVDVLLVRVRKALAPEGIAIVNVHGCGWQVSPEGAARLRAVMRGEAT